MKYEQLSEELRSELESKKFSAVRWSSTERDTVDDAILLDKGSDINTDRLDGYTIHTSLVAWFEYVSAPYGEDTVKATELATNALQSAV